MISSSREFQVFVKPVGSSCNLDCSYCYYLRKNQVSGHEHIVPMQDELLELYIRQHIETSAEQLISFSWHGGEPLLAGQDFFRKAVFLQKKWQPVGRSIVNGIQTNGTLMDESWARFLAEENFRLGISMDGPEDLHDQFRKSKDGRGSYKKVIRGYDLALIHGIDPEILCVVNAFNVKLPLLVYRHFKKLGAGTITFLPLVERRDTDNRTVSIRSVHPGDFGTFLCTVFDEWKEHDIGKIKVQVFEEALRSAFNQEHTLCIFKPVCGGVPAVERNGDFYPCDHYVDDKNRIGNIRERSLQELLGSAQQKTFGLSKLSLPQSCIDCDVRKMCNGECPKNRFMHTAEGEPGLNYLCRGYKMFFRHCLPFVESVSREYTRKI